MKNSSVLSSTSGALTVRDLHEDRLYVFSVVVSNAVGEVYTNAREICESAIAASYKTNYVMYYFTN